MSVLHVVFKVEASEYVISAAEVVQMESFQGATRVPGTEGHVAGLVQVRGKVVPVVSLRARFGLPAIEPTIDSRIVVVNNGGRTVGLLVDSAREVVKLAEDQLKPPPEALAERSQGFVKSVAQAGSRLLMLIDCEKVLGGVTSHGG
jgi:purine-binding chemotaxis protein CheW